MQRPPEHRITVSKALCGAKVLSDSCLHPRAVHTLFFPVGVTFPAGPCHSAPDPLLPPLAGIYLCMTSTCGQKSLLRTDAVPSLQPLEEAGTALPGAQEAPTCPLLTLPWSTRNPVPSPSTRVKHGSPSDLPPHVTSASPTGPVIMLQTHSVSLQSLLGLRH